MNGLSCSELLLEQGTPSSSISKFTQTIWGRKEKKHITFIRKLNEGIHIMEWKVRFEIPRIR